MHRKAMLLAAGLAAAGLTLSACGQAGPEPSESATQIKTYKVDGLPNVTTFCLGDLGYAMAVLGGNDSVSLARVYEKDTDCLNQGN